MTQTLHFGPGLQLWGGTGAVIGNLTYLGMQGVVFDGQFDKASATCAGAPVPLALGWVGKHWGPAPRVVGFARIYASRDQGFSNWNGPFTFTLRGSNDGALWDILGSASIAGDVPGAIVEIQAAVPQAAYTHHSVTIAPQGVSAYLSVAQVRFYSADNGGPPYVFTAPSAGRYHIELLTAGGGGGGGGAEGGGGGGGGGQGEWLGDLAAGEQVTFTLPRGGRGGRINGRGTPDKISGNPGFPCTALSNVKGVLIAGDSGGAGWPEGQSGPAGGCYGARRGSFGSAGQRGGKLGGSGGAGAGGGGAEGGGECGLPNGGGGGGDNGRVGGDGSPASARVTGPI